jgi:hypothetical protein
MFDTAHAATCCAGTLSTRMLAGDSGGAPLMDATKVSRRLVAFLAGAMLALACMAIAPVSSARDEGSADRWVGTWNASPQAASVPREINGQTIRQIVRVSIGGARVRVRLSNAYGDGSLLVGAARVGLSDTGASIVPGSDRC